MENTTTFRENDLSRTSRQFSSPRRQTRQASSDVDFRGNYERNPGNDYLRRKSRTKSPYNITCPSQSAQNNSMDSRPKDRHRRKNADKLETSLNQHLDYNTSKAVSPLGKNRSVQQQQSSLMSPRALTTHQRSQYHRPGSSRNRNNPGNTLRRRASRKHENIEPCECMPLVSTVGNIVNSDVETEDSDFPHSDDRMHSRNVRNQSDLYWHSPHGEPHFEPEMDSPIHNRHRDYLDSKKRHSGQGESVYENCRDTEAKVLIETGSSVDKDVWQQCERDKQELKDLYDDVDEFAKRKSAARIGSNLHDEDYTWDHSKQQRDKNKDDDADPQNLLENISQFIEKIPSQKKGYTARVSTGVSAKVSKAQSNISKEQLRGQSSKLDTRKTYHSVGIDGRGSSQQQQQQQQQKQQQQQHQHQHQEVGRNLDEELADFQIESLKQDEDEYLSETEEDARELVRDDTETEKIHRQLTKSWATCKRYSNICKSRISEKGEKSTRDQTVDKDDKICIKPDCGKKRVTTRERSKGRQEKSGAIISEESFEPLRLQNRLGTNDTTTDRKDCKRTRERSKPKEEMTDKIYEEFKNCYGVTAVHGTGDLELETSKTKTCIDEIIDNGLCREAKRSNGHTLHNISKELECEEDGTERGPLKRETSDEPSKIIRPDCFCPVSQNNVLSKAIKGDCFCKTLTDIVTDRRDPREYVRKLKNFRWSYLNHIQSDLDKLYTLEKVLDYCSPERRLSSVTFATEFTPDESKEIRREKRDKSKGYAAQSRI